MIPTFIKRPVASGGGGSKIVSLDFVNGIYTYNGNSLTAAQVVDITANIGINGLRIIPGILNQTAFINQVGALLLTGNWSLAAEFNLLDIAAPNVVSPFIALFDPTDTTTIDVGFRVVGPVDPSFGSASEFDGSTSVEIDATNFVSTNINIIQATRQDAFRAVTQNGDPVDGSFGSDTTNIPIAGFSPALTKAVTWSPANANNPVAYIRTMAIYDPVDATTLPTLAAV